MVLVDTSVWVSHFRKSQPQLMRLLESGDVVMHPFVLGELACGGLGNRREMLSLLQALPPLDVVSQEEYLHFVETRKLTGKGIGFVDIHLLASAVVSSDFLWTEDKSLQKSAAKLKLC